MSSPIPASTSASVRVVDLCRVCLEVAPVEATIDERVIKLLQECVPNSPLAFKENTPQRICRPCLETFEKFLAARTKYIAINDYFKNFSDKEAEAQVPPNTDLPHKYRYVVVRFELPSDDADDTKVGIKNEMEMEEEHLEEEHLDEAAFDDGMEALTISNVHTTVQSYLCRVCKLIFDSGKRLKRHFQRNHPQLDYCLYCFKTFKSQSYKLAFHTEMHVFDCMHCPETYDTLADLLLHVQATHCGDPSVACSRCDRVFWVKQQLFAHVEADHQVYATNCRHCNVYFTNNRAYREHMQRQHNDLKPYHCHLCGIGYMRSNSYEIHMCTKHDYFRPLVEMKAGGGVGKQLLDSTSTMCHICGGSFKNLEAHLEGHFLPGSQTYTCEICGKIFPNTKRLRIHIHQVHERRYRPKSATCTICNKTVVNSNSLTKHMRVHTNERPFVCQYCPAAFKTSSALIGHVRQHTDERPYACRHCERAFRDGQTLKKHERLHTGERPYKCQTCPQSFRVRDSLRRHAERVHNTKLPPGTPAYRTTPKTEIIDETEDAVYLITGP